MDLPSSPHVRTTLLDVMGYAGVALAITGVGIALGDADVAVQTVAGLLTTVVTLALGWLVARQPADEAAGRMRGIFWFVSLIAWSQVVNVLLGPEGADLTGRALAVLSGILLALLAVPLYWVERRSLQLIGVFLASVTVVAGLLYQEDAIFGQTIPDPQWAAVGVGALGAVTLWLGMRERLAPQRTAMVLGSIALLYGVLFATLDLVALAISGGEPSDLSAIAVFVAAVIVLFAGERTGTVAVFGIGVVGLLVGVLILVAKHARSEADGWVVVVLGLLLAAAVVVFGRRSATEPAAPEPGPELPPAPVAD
jgi:uncharacterized membrane protein HdeD (DUF308 family)